jgi:AmmeMemoRadiSam system protein A
MTLCIGRSTLQSATSAPETASAGGPLDREIPPWSAYVLTARIQMADCAATAGAIAMRPVSRPEPKRPSRGATRSPVVSPEEEHALLDLARVALAVAARRAPLSTLDRALEGTPLGDEPGSVFVTLTEGGELRGCIGSLQPERNLRVAVVASTLSAALDDPRFPPVTAGELPAIQIGISVLGPRRPITATDAFEPGLDGVIVERGTRRGLLLPEVAIEFSWGATQMFEAVCRKAGLPADSWRDPGTRLHSFRTVRFAGPATLTH